VSACWAVIVAGGAALALLSGCPDNPYDADTWIEKLDNQKEFERAVTEQTVDERRLANARRTEQTIGLAGSHQLANLIDAHARHVADADDLCLHPHESDPVDQLFQFFRGDQIRLSQ